MTHRLKQQMVYSWASFLRETDGMRETILAQVTGRNRFSIRFLKLKRHSAVFPPVRRLAHKLTVDHLGMLACAKIAFEATDL